MTLVKIRNKLSLLIGPTSRAGGPKNKYPFEGKWYRTSNDRVNTNIQIEPSFLAAKAGPFRNS